MAHHKPGRLGNSAKLRRARSWRKVRFFIAIHRDQDNPGDIPRTKKRMNLHRTLLHLCLSLPFLLVSCAGWRPGGGTPQYFPVSPGVSWTYDTHCEDTDLDLPMDRRVVARVLDTVQRKDVRVAVIQGFPFGITGAAGESLGADRCSALVQVGPMSYFLQGMDCFHRVRDPADKLLELVAEYALFLDGPLIAGRRFGDYDSLTRPDHMYCWYVESEEDIRIRGVRGVSSWRKHHVYRLVYATCPGTQRYTFAPGIGILEYSYSHHGMLSETRMKLVEFHQP